jgi:hypothetical protein
VQSSHTGHRSAPHAILNSYPMKLPKKEQQIIDAIALADRELLEWTSFKKRCEEELLELKLCQNQK